ncbi:ATP-binding protein [Spirulina sp. CS-785/01]|uniref:ATP-binding protein n=1 Tax=Spirulina sp. CS-785/01 TaxID=3021716 RepID=UPI00233033DE|nr:ATP-binding protein [Spirulina sp. CS-785/01]MDB9311965.1 ATP-binding protein [Spirulina sp. CS-785/01]
MISQSLVGSTEDSWYEQNSQYLTCSLTKIHFALDRYIARLQNQEDKLPSVDPANPEEIAAQMAHPPALLQLGQCFKLSEFERDMLVFCVGRAVHPLFRNLCALAHQNTQMDYPTFQLGLQLFSGSHWTALHPNSSLRRWQLLNWDEQEDITHARLQIDEAILHYLLGEVYQDKLLSGVIEPFFPIEKSFPLSPSHQQIVEQGVNILNSGQNRDSLVQLCGSDGEAKSAIAQHISQQLNLPLYTLSANSLSSDQAEMKRLSLRWERQVQLIPSLLVLEDSQKYSQEAAKPSPTETFLSLLKTPLIFSAPERIYLNHKTIIPLDIPPLSHREKLALWERSLGETATHLNGHLPRIVAQFNLSPLTIQSARLSLYPEESNPNLYQHLWDFCRLQARPRLEHLTQRIETQASWEDLVLPEREKNILRDLILQVRHMATVYEEWGFGGKGKRGLGISALFAGASGTGKTMAAEIIAGELHLDLFRVDLSAVTSKYIGETEKNLREIFDAAEKGGAVLLFDEADALFGKRTQVQDSRDRHANMEVSYLLQRMEAYQGLAILTTNLKDALDQAFIRRLRFIVNFPFPKAAARSEIWRRIFPPQTPTHKLDFQRLGQLNVAGGNIYAIALNSAFLAANEGEPVMMKHILQASQTEYLKLGKTLTDAEIKGW